MPSNYFLVFQIYLTSTMELPFLYLLPFIRSIRCHSESIFIRSIGREIIVCDEDDKTEIHQKMKRKKSILMLLLLFSRKTVRFSFLNWNTQHERVSHCRWKLSNNRQNDEKNPKKKKNEHISIYWITQQFYLSSIEKQFPP